MVYLESMPSPRASPEARPRPRTIIEKNPCQEVERAGPAGGQRGVGGHDPAAHEEEGQQLREQHRRLPGPATVQPCREPEGKEARQQRTPQREAAHAEFAVAEAGDAQVDHPRDHGRMVEVAVVEVLGVVPVVGLPPGTG